MLLVLMSPLAMAIDKNDYPHPVKTFTFESQQQMLSMRSMDVQSEGQPKRIKGV